MRLKLVGVYTIHAPKKLLDRVKQPVVGPVIEPTTALGNWYATVLLWKPQAALLVNERTLVPALVPLAPATKPTFSKSAVCCGPRRVTLAEARWGPCRFPLCPLGHEPTLTLGSDRRSL